SSGTQAQGKFSKKAEKYFKTGNEFSDLGKYHAAEKEYLKAVAISKDYSAAYQRLGYVYMQLQNYPKMYESLNRVIKIGGNFPNEVYFRIAQSCFALGKFREAEDFLFQYSSTPKMSEGRKQELAKLKSDLAFAKMASQ